MTSSEEQPTGTKRRLTIITNAGRASNARRARHNKAALSETIIDYYCDPPSAKSPIPPSALLKQIRTPLKQIATPRAPIPSINRPLPPTPRETEGGPSQFLTPAVASPNPRISAGPRSTVLLLSRSVFNDPESEDEGVLRRRPHIRRHHRRIQSASSPLEAGVLEMPLSHDDDDDDDIEYEESLSPLIESLTKLYTDAPRPRQRSYTLRSVASASTDHADRIDSPLNYAPGDEEEEGADGKDPLLKALAEGRLSTLHDWENGIHYRDAKFYGLPEGRLLPKRAPTKEVKSLLQERRKRAGLSVDLRQETMDIDEYLALY